MMAVSDNVASFHRRPKLNLDADVGGTLLDRLRSDPPFKEAWKRKLRTKDKSIEACATRIITYARNAGCDDQTCYDLLVTWQRSHGEAPITELAWYNDIITKAKEAEAVAREAETTALALDSYRKGSIKHTREEALQSLSALLGVDATTSIESIKRYRTDPRSYVIALANGSYIECSSQQVLLSQKSLGGLLWDYASISMPTFKRSEWENVKRCLLQCLEDVEVSADATHLGECKEWLQVYLRTHLRPERVHETQVRMALDGEAALLVDEVWFSMEKFRRVMMLQRSTALPSKEILSVRLKQIGCEYQQHKAFRTTEGRNTSRSLWRAPRDIAQEAIREAHERQSRSADVFESI
jgi:hypothetical protein